MIHLSKKGAIILLIIALVTVLLANSHLIISYLAEDPDADDFLKIYGNISQTEGDLSEVIELSHTELTEYIGSDSQIVGYAISDRGYIEIFWNEKTEPDTETMDRIYSVLNKNGKEAGIKNVPVGFRLSSE